MTYTFRCLDCGNTFDWHNIQMVNRDKVHPPCHECGGTNNKRIVPRRLFFTIAETNSPISAKPDSYWNNAERNAKKARKKKAEEHFEKMEYDESYRQRKLNETC